MVILLIILMMIYAFFQIRFYIQQGYKKEIVIFLVIHFISTFYILSFLKDTNPFSPEGGLVFLFDPLAQSIFGIP